MALVVDQQPSFKYYCRICKKGFGCGRALGGHMRAHGIGDEINHMDDDDSAGDWDDKLGAAGNPPPGTKRMYALRTNPNRLKNCRICENCGKEFSSWKAFLEHGKCSSEDAEESLVSSPGSDDYDDDVDERRGFGWSKGKRTRRLKLGNGNSNSNCPSSEDEDLANCLVMLSTARVDPLVAETESSCASASKDEERRNLTGVATATPPPPPAMNRLSNDKAKGVVRGMFECKACKKVFNSHQALGGHRASHKKVKGCFAAKLDDLDESQIDEDVITNDDFSMPNRSINAILPYEHQISHPPLAIPSKRKSKVHECSICHRVFTSGQALGGHKRCHWVTSNSPDTSHSIPRFHQLEDHNHQLHQRPKINKSEPLDLNLPAPIDDVAGIRQDSDTLLSFEVPTAIYLQPWIGVHSNHHHHHHHHHHQNNDNLSNSNSNSNSNNNQTTTNNNNNNAKISGINVDDEVDSKVKLAKLSDLKDMNLGGGSSPWLQVGIGSTGNGSSDT
ncbi:zinc finger protein ZAT9-like [Telopea speciosissima]|uniref:zinc finger protein ZAT9-like n=1 Tax=Telopea speciosissima TaxID=54955 RepID=UPI001CC3F581|nr:zinc finger protein ZAT9-like [Telopea speciosissima]